MKVKIRKIKSQEFEKLNRLFPSDQEMWIKYKEKMIPQLEKQEIDLFIIQKEEQFIGEITVNYKNNQLATETIPNRRVYLEAFRIDKKYQGQGLGQKLIQFTIHALLGKGYTEFTIGVEEDNEIAKHIYSKLGFEEAIDKGIGNEFDPCEYTLYLKDIKKTEVDRKIEKLMKQTELGKHILSIQKVTGGLSHRTYKVVTDKGTYAVKELNPGIMKRKQAYSNFIYSEKVAQIAKQNGIQAVTAIEIKKESIQKIDNCYFMIFDWIEGKTITPSDITEKHCKIMGKTLANIHNIDFSGIEEEERKKITIEEMDWNGYLKFAESKHKSYVTLLKQNMELLYELQQKSSEALPFASQNLVISHTDLDSKNVIWQQNTPFIIDWEASGYINPTIELIQVAWYWSGGDREKIDYHKFRLVVESYKIHAKSKLDTNIDKLVYADMYSGLEWLSYNLKRSLCIENTYDQEEIELAENEIVQSIQEIQYNVDQISNILHILKCN